MDPELIRITLALVAAIAAILSARALGRRIAKMEATDAAARRTVAAPAGLQPEPPRTAAPAPAPPTEPAPPVAAGAQPRIGLREVRRGIVLSAVLGPCRAHEAQDDPASWN